MSASRRQFLGGAGALATLPWLFGPVRAAAPPAPATLSFLALGDWGQPRALADATTVAAQLAQEARTRAAAFIISTGDNFYDRGVADTADPLWQAAFETIYADPALQVPWYVVLGNHDYGGQPDAELAYALRSDRWTLPARYYVEQYRLIDGTGADFFFLDTTGLVNLNFGNRWFFTGAAARAQLDWLDTMLGASTARWKIVVGHHPVFSHGAHGDSPALVEGVLPILQRHRVQIYLNGHDHNLEHAERDGIHFLTSGGGAEQRPVTPVEPPGFAAASLGFLSATLAPDRLEITFIDQTGTPLHQATIPA
ncbi:tartrate-resistant acid phosphatase type 5 family protein [Devosia sp. 1566]|uniref:purple acid phosphatase family protein n=1 Tax=Devosia sp. 1566 TaxID=2499144 RepID=UPI000FDB5D7D|nr:tartrate-resistant acid phosphatase type 5 family protein [Devosia sp. 1566]